MSPTSPDADRPNRLPWPPILYVLLIAGAYALERWAPLAAMPEDRLVRGLGFVVMAAGIGLAIAGAAKFRKLGTPVNPTGQAKALATGGIYAYTRNPMYVGGVTAFLGAAFGFGSAWLLIGAVLMPFALYVLAIRGEEAFLARRFGKAYDDYRARVRRWV